MIGPISGPVVADPAQLGAALDRARRLGAHHDRIDIEPPGRKDDAGSLAPDPLDLDPDLDPRTVGDLLGPFVARWASSATSPAGDP